MKSVIEKPDLISLTPEIEGKAQILREVTGKAQEALNQIRQLKDERLPELKRQHDEAVSRAAAAKRKHQELLTGAALGTSTSEDVATARAAMMVAQEAVVSVEELYEAHQQAVPVAEKNLETLQAQDRGARTALWIAIQHQLAETIKTLTILKTYAAAHSLSGRPVGTWQCLEDAVGLPPVGEQLRAHEREILGAIGLQDLA